MLLPVLLMKKWRLREVVNVVQLFVGKDLNMTFQINRHFWLVLTILPVQGLITVGMHVVVGVAPAQVTARPALCAVVAASTMSEAGCQDRWLHGLGFSWG